jgi:hypothetical protein|tara:strand:- start:26341 stop:27570 length:1230 start_codon:yes stop_codon:yes gene_type:complete
MSEASTNKFSLQGQEDGPLSSMPKGTKPIGSRTKKNKVYEDARYDPTPGGMEWGTPQGTDYFKSLTPGEGKEREKPLKPLNIKARKPEDEKGVKVTEGLRQQFEPEYSEAKRRLGNKIRGKLGLKKKPTLDWKKDAGIKEDLDLSHIEDKQADHSKHQYPINNEVETHDKGDKGHWLTGKDGDWYIEQDDIKELDKEAENYTFDKAVDDGLYDDDELEWEDFDNTPGFDNEINVTEALSVQGRLKRRFNARRNKQKLKVARRIALRRGSTPDRLKKRATRGARLMVYKRLLRGRDRAGLPPAEKARLERMITRFQPLVSRISVKLLPQMRRNEIKRLTGRAKLRAKTSKKFKAAKPVKSASQKRAKKFKIKVNKYKAPKKKAAKPRYASGGPTLKKASKAYKAFSYSIG